jgi:hypothetical protein
MKDLPPRYFHALVIVRDYLVVFGGINTYNFQFNDIHVIPTGNIITDSGDSIAIL